MAAHLSGSSGLQAKKVALLSVPTWTQASCKVVRQPPLEANNKEITFLRKKKVYLN